MKELQMMIKRNIKLFFKDKGMLFTSLITPLILLVLYATFLSNVYRDSFTSSLPAGITVSEDIIDGLVGGQLFSSLLAVSCVTVSFCCNLLMVQDKVNGANNDFMIAPVKKSTLALAYYVATAVSTLIVCLIAIVVCCVYLAFTGWYLSFLDVLCLLLDTFLLVMFGTALSSIVNSFLSSQGQISAVGSIVSAGYGFICGAYMPISSFSNGLQKVISFLPGTYGTSLFRNHAVRGVFEAMGEEGIPQEVITALKDSIDCNIYFFENQVSIGAMYAILGVSIAVLIAVYIFIHRLRSKKK